MAVPVPSSTISQIVAVEDGYLKVRQADYQKEKTFLQRGLKHGDEEIVVLSEQQKKEEQGAQADVEELQRMVELFGKGTLVSQRIIDARRAVLLSATRRLQTSA